MKTKKVFLNVSLMALPLIIFMNSCTSSNEVSDLNNLENREKCEIKMVDNVIVSQKEQIQLRSMENSNPIYRYYSNNADDHFYSSTYLGSNCVENENSYYYEGSDFQLEPSYNVYTTKYLYRYYSPTKKNHRLSTILSLPGYINEGRIGYVFTSPQLGTIPLKEYYNSKVDKYHYVVRNSEITWLKNNNLPTKSIRIIGYVYPGSFYDEEKTANVLALSKITAIPSYVTMIVSLKDGNSFRKITYTANMPSYTNGRSGAYSEVVLDPAWVIYSVDMTVTTFDRNGGAYTNKFFITASQSGHTGIIKGDMSIRVSASTSESGEKTTFNISYDNIIDNF